MRVGEVVDEKGGPIDPDGTYRPHLRLWYYRALEQEDAIPFEESVLFQDDYLVVADKPHFLPVVPTGRYLQHSLLVRLKRKLGIETLTPMHRIDRLTAGLVLFSVQPPRATAISSCFAIAPCASTTKRSCPGRKAPACPACTAAI